MREQGGKAPEYKGESCVDILMIPPLGAGQTETSSVGNPEHQN